MTKELIINVIPQGVEIALLENKKLVELHSENADANFAVGDIYLGKVKKLIPGLNAAFIDVGFEKDAFLHYTDLSPYVRSILKFTNICVNQKKGEPIDLLKRIKKLGELINVSKLKVLIIDEVSMLSDVLFELSVSTE